ncbi:diaminopimelate decarboxylase [Glaciihabitans arcticus]|uniref:Diaminopimelate decarboxylase n=1 Tax=Glaciihabitans arcticus TaxID=2668039 RepID=A0A4Q9GUQ6_9MICO|nr:diaminopimelate decarboxylase [Glaciihabitans arcticus]TBN56303.1 diaminopimelate decarboxylase [Glaciihabitans arcticus]
MSDNPLAPSWLVRPHDANALAPSVWSQNAERAADGELLIAGASAIAIAAEYGTPVYVIDEADVRTRARGIRDSFDAEFAAIGSSVKVYYAGKAFLSTQVAAWMIEDGLNIDVCSGGELAVALAGGAPPERLGLHGNNKSVAEIDRAVGVGIGAIVLDSLIEIERVAEAAARHGRVQPVRLRVNSGVHAHTHEYLATAREDQKFGIPLAEVAATVASIRSHDSLEFLGLHSHIGSQIFESDGFAEATSRLFAVHAELLAGGPVPELNLGGGFGIAYTSVDDALPIPELARRLAAIVATAAAERGIPVPVIAIEPGRSIIGPSMTTLYTVGTIKDVVVSDASTGSATAVRKYVSVDGGMSDNIRPALYAADYSARIANRSSTAAPALVRVAGKHCESGDILVHADYLPGDVQPGDLLAIPATGAYGWAMASNYNYLARPPVVAVKTGRTRVIVRGETEADLLSRDAGLDTE